MLVVKQLTCLLQQLRLPGVEHLLCHAIGASLPPILDQLLKLYPLRQPLLVRHTTEVLTALASAPSSAMTSSQLSQLLGVVLESDEIWDRRNADAVLALTRLVECGMMTLHQKDAGACRQRLPKAFHVLVHQVGRAAVAGLADRLMHQDVSCFGV